MADAMMAAALIVLAATAAAGLRVLTRRDGMEQILAMQLLGTGGAAVLLLLAVAQGFPAILDVALVLVLLAAFSSTAFALAADLRVDLGVEDDGRSENGPAGDSAALAAGGAPELEPSPSATTP